MMLQILFALFLKFNFSESFQVDNSSWNPCPLLRSTFQGIVIDGNGRKRPNCVCYYDLFGDQCQFKVYVSSVYDGKQNTYPKNSHQPEHNIYPLEYLDLIHYPNRSTVIMWRHATIIGVQYYVLQFRELADQGGVFNSSGPWRPLVYIKPERSKCQDLMSFQFNDFYNYTIYEMNLGIAANDSVIVSVSVLRDNWNAQRFQDVHLGDVMFSASVTWSTWGAWGSCETLRGCGKGKQRRSRVMVTNYCVTNKTEETRACKLKSCPVNGGWSRWSVWSQCSVTCNNGTRLRLRTCTRPAPKHGGEMCFGSRLTNQTCVNKSCMELSGDAISKWPTLEKLKSLHFTSIVVGFAAGFAVCLLVTACPHFLKRCKRRLKHKYELLKDKDFHVTNVAEVPKSQVSVVAPKQSPSKSSLSPPVAPPPPAMNWRPIPVQHVLPSSPQPTQPSTSKGAWRPTRAQTQEMAKNMFMEELLKAFKTFNVDANKHFENVPDKRLE